MNKGLKEKILKLNEQGFSRKEIQEKLKCSYHAIAHHLSEKIRINSYYRQKKYREKIHPYIKKIRAFSVVKKTSNRVIKKVNLKINLTHRIESFHKENGNKMYIQPKFNADDVLNKFGEKPICYLTGKEIDIYNYKSYQFDHIVPRSKGGSNELDNLGICCSEANKAKHDMNYDDFIELCKKIVEYDKIKKETK